MKHTNNLHVWEYFAHITYETSSLEFIKQHGKFVSRTRGLVSAASELYDFLLTFPGAVKVKVMDMEYLVAAGSMLTVPGALLAHQKTSDPALDKLFIGDTPRTRIRILTEDDRNGLPLPDGVRFKPTLAHFKGPTKEFELADVIFFLRSDGTYLILKNRKATKLLSGTYYTDDE